jgi:hypothetical protein
MRPASLPGKGHMLVLHPVLGFNALRDGYCSGPADAIDGSDVPEDSVISSSLAGKLLAET